jgi:hypothetical protein
MKKRIVRIPTTAITILILLLILFYLQSSALADEGGIHEHEHGYGLSLSLFIEPLGICALSLVLITFGTGLFRRKLGRRFLKIHRIFAYLAAGFALCHGILVLALF